MKSSNPILSVSAVLAFAMTGQSHAAPAAASSFDADRKAILAMLGEYKVSFHFQETVVLTPGYETKPSKDTGGHEVVILVEDTGNKIVLQHILVGGGGHVTKHWRQDWTFEAPERFEFSADQTWSRAKIAAESTKGAWTQCVFEVSDAPRYCGTGKWNHRHGNPTWTSDRSWRPLPRREYTKRSDYNAINAENRQTITPNGWTHEQDNSKTIRTAGSSTVLTREFGFNDYRRVSDYDFKPAYDYWKKTADYWAVVRAVWDRRLHAGASMSLTTKVDGMPIIMALFGQAEDSAPGKPVAMSEVNSVLEQYTAVQP